MIAKWGYLCCMHLFHYRRYILRLYRSLRKGKRLISNHKAHIAIINRKPLLFDESNRIEQTKLLFDSTRIRICILNSIRFDLASNRIRFDVRKFDRSPTVRKEISLALFLHKSPLTWIPSVQYSPSIYAESVPRSGFACTSMSPTVLPQAVSRPMLR